MQQGQATDIAGLTARSGALRQAATLSGADLGSLLDAALAELDAAIDELKAAGGPEDGGSGRGPGEAVHAAFSASIAASSSASAASSSEPRSAPDSVAAWRSAPDRAVSPAMSVACPCCITPCPWS